MTDGTVHPRFARVVERFTRLFKSPSHGGGALAIYHRGEPVVDVWAGWARPGTGQPWQQDTLALSFSTTKGVIATLAHRLVEQGTLDYQTPIATWWPAFAAEGKQDVTLYHVLTHTAGLHNLRALISESSELLDYEHVTALLAAAPTRREPGAGAGYHGLTFGWLVAAVLEHATGRDIRTLLREELAIPLGVDDLYFGAPPSERHRLAALIGPMTPAGVSISRLGRQAERVRATRPFAEALLVDGFDELMMTPGDERILDTVMPAANGVFTARALAKLYGALANAGEVQGARLLEARTVRSIGRVQRRERDYVLGMPMRWRLGYHRVFTTGRMPRRAFGHFGFGGSGAWADPETGLSLAFTTNRLGNATTPIGDARLARLGRLAIDAVA